MAMSSKTTFVLNYVKHLNYERCDKLYQSDIPWAQPSFAVLVWNKAVRKMCSRSTQLMYYKFIFELEKDNLEKSTTTTKVLFVRMFFLCSSAHSF